jgi:hypothetical protein
VKTKKLIELLQKEDPTGELEACIGNEDILSLDTVDAYYDGCLEILHRDWSLPYYNVIGATITSKGAKVRIHTESIEDALFDEPDMPVEVIDTFDEKRMADRVGHWREKAREIKDKLEAEMLIRVLQKYRDGWKAAQALAEPLNRCNVQWWWKEEDKGTRRLYYGDKGEKKQVALCQGESLAVIDSKFFKPVNDGQRIVWEIIFNGM